MDNNPLFSYSSENHYLGISPLGYMRPINSPASQLKPVVSASFDPKKKAFDLTPQYNEVVYQVPKAFIDSVDKRVMYAFNKLF